MRRPYAGVAVSRRVIVNLKSGEALNGVLLESRGPLLIMGDVQVMEPGSHPVSAQGQVIVERENISFTQVV